MIATEEVRRLHRTDLGRRLEETVLQDRNRPKSPTHDNTLHMAIRPLLVTAQCFALMPVSGIGAALPEQLHFTWWSPRVLYSLVSILGSGCHVLYSLLRLIKNDFQFNYSIGMVFFVNASLISLSTLNLARNWPRLMCDWARVEAKMAKYRRAKDLRRIFKTVLVVFLTITGAEHAMSIVATVSTLTCPEDETGAATTGCSLWEQYFRKQQGHVYEISQYALWKAILLLFSNILCTFSWNFIELYIMMLSIAAAELFERIKHRLFLINPNSIHPEYFWHSVREDFTLVSDLCRRLDATISHIILLSYYNNFYFLCIQLLFTVENVKPLIRGVYFWCSISYLFGRILLVTHCASKVYEESKACLPALFTISSQSYGHEVTQLIAQIQAENVALTGFKLFVVRKRFLLTIFGCIVTYELILLQNKVNKSVS